MKLFLSFIISTSVFSVSQFSQAQSNSPWAAHKNPGVGAIVITGDSLAAGYKATDPSVKPEGCLSQLPNTGVFNYAVKGKTSEEILIYNSKVLSHKPSLVFVSSGGNDAIINTYKPGSYPKEKSYSEMDAMLGELIHSGALVVYLGLDPNIRGSERMPEIAKIAKQKGARVVDGMKGLWGKRKYMADAVHPNNEGYKIMCERILEAVKGYYP